MFRFSLSFKYKSLGKLFKDVSELMDSTYENEGAQSLSGIVLDSRPRCRGFVPHRRHCVVVL